SLKFPSQGPGPPSTSPPQTELPTPGDISRNSFNCLLLGPGRPLPTFPTSECTSDVEPDTRDMVRAQNKKKKKSGGFQSMGLSYPVFKGIMKKGYKVPTPIQRKTIPMILDGKDVVAMARTGSGKTACFLIPMFERLKTRSAQTGARALILSPTRELALQTMKFTKELGKFTGLRTALILGGDKIEDQFAALHENPDVIIATPGRLVHVAVEMNLKLQSVEYVVFDEADSPAETWGEVPLVLMKTPGWTYPQSWDSDHRDPIPEPLVLPPHRGTPAMAWPALPPPAGLLTPLPPSRLHSAQLLTTQGVSCAHIYSALDQTARKINLAKFTHGKCSTLIVTDLAARGLDIPLLDNVINYSFPAKGKLFLHRVGRVARAGRSGTAYSLVAPDEVPYLLDLHLFLGRALTLARPHEGPSGEQRPGHRDRSSLWVPCGLLPLALDSGWTGGWRGQLGSPGAAGVTGASVRQDVFTEVIGRKRQQPGPERGAKRRREEARHRDREFYIHYRPKDFDSERGSVAGGGWGGGGGGRGGGRGGRTQDRKKKRFVGQSGQEDKKKIKTESASLTPFPSYRKWKQKQKVDDRDSEDEGASQQRGPERRGGKRGRGQGASQPRTPAGPAGRVRSELKTKQQILKQRRRAQKLRFLQRGGLKQLSARPSLPSSLARRGASGRGVQELGVRLD
uniref:RNA helicase n=1 Tax=Panthera tigris altaica TaxID=74533 RepID=A0A8C9KFD3_PANTA